MKAEQWWPARGLRYVLWCVSATGYLHYVIAWLHEKVYSPILNLLSGAIKAAVSWPTTALPQKNSPKLLDVKEMSQGYACKYTSGKLPSSGNLPIKDQDMHPCGRRLA